jgi:hypothetical protein
VPSDYDGDGRADPAVYRTTTGEWFILNSSGPPTHVGWGAPSLGDVPVPADFDDDGRTDIAIYRLLTGEWFVIRSTNGSLLTLSWGAPSLGDMPLRYPWVVDPSSQLSPQLSVNASGSSEFLMPTGTGWRTSEAPRSPTWTPAGDVESDGAPPDRGGPGVADVRPPVVQRPAGP